MANDEWKAIDNELTDFMNSYCAFIDILGYKRHITRTALLLLRH